MATLGEVLNLIKTETAKDTFKKMPFGQQNMALKQMLGRSDEFNSLGFADRARKLKQVQEATGILGQVEPTDLTLGDVGQAALEFGLPIIGGLAAARGGGPGMVGALRGAGGAAGAGQLAEFTRPLLTDEPMRGLQEQALRRAAEAGGEIGGQALAVGISRGITASSNIVKNAIRKSLISTEEVGAKAKGAAAVFAKKGVAQAPFQFRGDNPAGLMGALEEIAFNSIGGDAVLNRMQAKQMSAAGAWLEEMGVTMADQADGPSLVLFMEGLVKNRRELARGVEKALFKNFENTAGNVKIDISDIINTQREFIDIKPIRETLEGIFPESFTERVVQGAQPGAPAKLVAKQTRAEAKAAAAQASRFEAQIAERTAAGLSPDVDPLVRAAKQARAEAKRLSAIAQAEEAGVAARGAEEFAQDIEAATGPSTITLSGGLSRISELRRIARNARGVDAARIRNVASKAAGDLERTIEATVSDEALPLWTAAKEFTRTSRETLSNKSLVKFMDTLSDKPDTFLNLMLGRGRSDDMLKLKTALSKPIKAPDGSFIPGSNFWESAVQPRILNTIIDKSKTGLGREIGELSGDKLANTLRGVSKQQTDSLLGRGTFDSLRDLSDALTTAKARPGGRFAIFVRSAQIGAVLSAGGIELLPEGGPFQQVGALGGVALAISPIVMAKVMTNPALMRNLARAIKVPGPKNRALAAVVGRIAAQSAADTIADTQLDETLESLKEVQVSRFGKLIPPNNR